MDIRYVHAAPSNCILATSGFASREDTITAEPYANSTSRCLLKIIISLYKTEDALARPPPSITINRALRQLDRSTLNTNSRIGIPINQDPNRTKAVIPNTANIILVVVFKNFFTSPFAQVVARGVRRGRMTKITNRFMTNDGINIMLNAACMVDVPRFSIAYLGTLDR